MGCGYNKKIIMLAIDIISKFDTYTDDMSELTPGGKLDLLNNKWHWLQRQRKWQWTIRQAQVLIVNGVILLPGDFRGLLPNENENSFNYPHTFYVGNNFYPIYRSSQRNRYRDLPYLDTVNKTIVVPAASGITGTASFDYFAWMPNLEEDTDLDDYLDEQYQHILYYKMATEHSIIDQSEKARSYAPENNTLATEILEDMELEDAELQASNLGM